MDETSDKLKQASETDHRTEVSVSDYYIHTCLFSCLIASYGYFRCFLSVKKLCNVLVTMVKFGFRAGEQKDFRC